MSRSRTAAVLLLSLLACTTKTIGPPSVDRREAPDDGGTSSAADDCKPEECPAIDDFPAGCAQARCVDGACRYVARDADGDDFTARRCLSRTAGVSVETGDDCDDGDEQVNPNQWDGPAGDGFDDACGDGVDQDCSGRIDDGRLSDGSSCICRTGDTGVCMETSGGALIEYPALDADDRPLGTCQLGARECLPNGTWGPCVGAIGPSAETCDGLDNDCDTIESADDEDTPKTRFYCDRDSDGQLSNAEVPKTEPAPPEDTPLDPEGAAESSLGCAPSGACEGLWLSAAQAQFYDCDDADPLRYLGNIEGCDGRDTDCDGQLDGPSEDDDGDGYADDACAGGAAGDCDDLDSFTFLGAPEACDGKDNDCTLDGTRHFAGTSGAERDEDYDGDGHSSEGASCLVEVGSTTFFAKDDCDDFDATVFTGAPELCDGKDNDCDGRFDELSSTAVAGSVCAPRAIAAGYAHSCALLSDGGVACWGSSTGADIGVPGLPPGTAVRVPGIAGALQVAVGDTSSCALLEGGTVTCWGDGGVVPDGFGPIAGITGATQVTVGAYHACALVDGEVYCWGYAQHGEVDGITQGGVNLPPTQVAPGVLTNVTDVDAGDLDTCAVTGAGQVSCWGDGGLYGAGGTVLSPTFVGGTGPGAPGSLIAVEVTVGAVHACARGQSGEVACWGQGSYGQLGPGIASSSTPVPISGSTDAVEIAAGEAHTCARLSDDTLRCWGDNQYAQLGAGDTATHAEVIEPGAPTAFGTLAGVRAVSAGSWSTCALDADGVWCWGEVPGAYDKGRMGLTAPVRMSHLVRSLDIAIDRGPLDNSTSFTTCFVVAGGRVQCANLAMGNYLIDFGAAPLPMPYPRFDGHFVRDFATQLGMVCAVYDAGEVGCGPQLFASLDPPAIDDAVAVTMGLLHRCVVHGDGSVTCWGENADGQLGAATSPGNPALPGWVVHVVAGDRHTCARLLDGRVACWGANALGESGQPLFGSTVSTPRVVDLPAAAVDLATFGHSSCAVLEDTSVHCWGDNAGKQLGNDIVSSSAGPMPVAGAGPAVEVALSYSSACVRKVGGQVACWGSDRSTGILGDGAPGPTTRLIPTNVPDLIDAALLECAASVCCAVRTSGQTLCWGAGQAMCSESGSGVPAPVRELGPTPWCCSAPQATCP